MKHRHKVKEQTPSKRRPKVGGEAKRALQEIHAEGFFERETLRAALESLGLDHIQFARLMGVTYRCVTLWLSGQRSMTMPSQILLRLLLSGKISVGDVYNARPVALDRKAPRAGTVTGKNVWERVYENAKQVVDEK